MKVFTQLCPPPHESEIVDKQDLAILDKESITSVKGFIEKFQADADFNPPSVDVSFDTDNYDVSIDDEIDTIFPDDTSILDDINDLKTARDENSNDARE